MVQQDSRDHFYLLVMSHAILKYQGKVQQVLLMVDVFFRPFIHRKSDSHPLKNLQSLQRHKPFSNNLLLINNWFVILKILFIIKREIQNSKRILLFNDFFMSINLLIKKIVHYV